MSKIAVVVDSGSSLSKIEADQAGIFYLPLLIVEGQNTYLDGIDISIDEVFNKIEQKVDLKTSLPSIGYMHELIQDIKDQGYDSIIAVTLTSGLSSTLNSFKLACNDMDMEVACIEVWTTCFLQGYVALKAKELVDAGKKLAEIELILNKMISDSDTLIVPNDLEHLKRGGRLTPLAASMANLLKIRPILQMNKQSLGKIDTKDKVRTCKKALLKMVDDLHEQNKINENYQLIICGTKGSEASIDILKTAIKQYNNDVEIEIRNIAPVIAVHTGIDCVGVQYIKRG